MGEERKQKPSKIFPFSVLTLLNFIDKSLILFQIDQWYFISLV